MPAAHNGPSLPNVRYKRLGRLRARKQFTASPSDPHEIDLCLSDGSGELLQLVVCVLPGNLLRQNFDLGREQGIGQ